MNRRVFISFSTFIGVSSLLHSTNPIVTKAELSKDIFNIINSVQEHFFPENSQLPSAREFRAVEFLNDTIFHKTFDKDIREFVISGAKDFISQENGKFINYSYEEKEIALRKFENSTKGSQWLSRIMILSMEALLSDPIYGGNYKESGWKALDTKGGEPRPESRYIKL